VTSRKLRNQVFEHGSVIEIMKAVAQLGFDAQWCFYLIVSHECVDYRSQDTNMIVLVSNNSESRMVSVPG